MSTDKLHYLKDVFNYNNYPKTIVSLVPSQTELLYYLGLDNEVAAITKFCVHPNIWFKNKTKIGGTKTIDVEVIKSLKPDLVLANKEENIKEQVEAVSQFCPVYVSDVNNVHDAIQMITDIGELTRRKDLANTLCNQIQESFQKLHISQNIKTAYFIWQKPYMTVGGDTFISDMMHHCGLENIFRNQTRYPEVNIEQLQKMACELLLLSSEPFPFRQKHIDELQQQLPGTKIMLADGEMFSWYGSRILEAIKYFRKTFLANDISHA